MGLFDGLGGSSGGTLDVGAVKATLAYDHDKRGLRQWDSSVDKARRESRRPIEQNLRGDYDRRGFDQYGRAVSRAHRDTSLLGRAGTTAGRGLLAVGRGALYAAPIVGGAFLYGVKKSVEASSDLNETVNATEAIFKGSAKEILAWSRTSADGFGLARSESLQAAASIGAMLKPMGFAVPTAAKMSKKMVELAGDMASFNNEDPTEMLERIRSGLAGESEPLRRFGVDLRVTAVEQFALNKGIAEQGEKLEGAKFAQAAYAKILADTTDQQGDFSRTGEGLANVQRRLRANLIDLSAEFGDVFRPLVQGAANDINDFVLGMRKGTGTGGDFRSWLEDRGHDVEAFAKGIENVLSNDALDPEEKARRIFGKFSDVAVDALEAAIPRIASAAGHAAPIVAGAFIRGFIQADSWGRLALGALLIAKFGGWGAIRGTGALIGGGVAEGAAGGVAGTAAGGAAAGGLAGRLRGVLGRAGLVARRLGVIGLGLAVGDNIMNGIQRRINEGSDDVKTALGAISEKQGVVSELRENILGPYINQLFGDADVHDEKVAAENLNAQYGQMLKTRVKISKATEGDLRLQLEGLNVSGRVRTELERMLSLQRRGRQLGVGVDLSMDPGKLGAIQNDLQRLRGGVFKTAEDIERASHRAGSTIVDQFGKGTKEARHLTAQNLRATAEAFSRSMKESGRVTEQGMKRVKDLIRKADLVEGINPAAFGQQFARAFGRAGDVTQQQLDSIIAQFRRMPKGARQAAYDAMQGQLRELRRGGRLSRDEVKQIRSRVLSEFGGIKTGATRSTYDLVANVLGNFGGLGDGIAAGLETIRENTNKGLGAFNVDPIKWAVKTIGNLLGITGGKTKKQARGGFLPGASRDDVVPVLAGRDEAFVTSWQQRPIETALQVSSAMGAQPYPSLNALFAGEQRSHGTGPQRRAKGGFAAGPFQGRDSVLGSGPGFVPFMNYLNSMFGPLQVISGLRPGSITTSGNVSNHSWGGAVDISTPGVTQVTGPGDLAAAPASAVNRMDATHAFIGSHFQPMLLDFLWRTFTGGNHWNHIHTGIDRPYSFDAERMMQYISTLPEGGSFGAIPRVVLEGPEGPLHDWGQRQLDQVRKAANDWKSRQVGFGVSAFPGDPHAIDSIVTGRVSYFGGGNTAGGKIADRDAGLALNLDPGSDSGWNNETTQGWMRASLAGHPVYARTTIQGHTANLPIIDLGPAGFTNRAIDVTTPGVRKLGLDPANFPTDSIGKAAILSRSRGGWARASKGGLAGKILGLYGKLTNTRGAGKRDEILDEIHKLEKRLKRKRRKSRRQAQKKIRAKGDMEGWRTQIDGAQDFVERLDEQIGGLETTHGLTEPRDIEQILRQLGLDPETDLGNLTDDQKAQVRAAIDADYGLEERENEVEIDFNERELKGLLNLRRTLLGAIKEGERRIARALAKAKKADEEAKRLEKLARQVEQEIEKLKEELQAIGRGKPPPRAKGESKKDHKAKVEAWQNDRKQYAARLHDRIARGWANVRDYKERAQGWRGVADAQRANAKSLGSFLADEVRPSLEDTQGVGRSMDPGVAIAPLGVEAPQFGGRILDTQAKLAELGATDFVRPDPFRGGEEEDDGETARKEREAELTAEELARYKRLERVMAAQAPVFAASQGFPKLLARGGFALDGMLAPFVGSFRVGSAFIPRDGLAMVHRGEEIRSKERVVEKGGGDVHLAMHGDLAALAQFVRLEIIDELDARGQKAAAAARRPASSVIARRAPQ